MSAKKRSKTEDAGHNARSGKPSAPNGKTRKQRSSDLGRALRSIYDDTLRETVPDDFLSLIGKLS
ncbi:MAG TPA: NepR family anti-sigma factor [Sphingomicrobium sp.]